MYTAECKPKRSIYSEIIMLIECFFCKERRNNDKNKTLSSLKEKVETFPLNGGEGAILRENEQYEYGRNEYLYAFGENYYYDYSYGLTKSDKIITSTVIEYNVEQTKNCTLYKFIKLDDDASYVWFNSKYFIDCDLKPGRYSISEYSRKCGGGGGEYLGNGVTYIFKTSPDSKDAYVVDNENDVGYISENNKFEVKSYSDLDSIINSYPQSSSIIIPSILMILAILFLLM